MKPILAVCVAAVLLAGLALPPLVAAASPDLKVRQFQFPPTNDKALRVEAANFGNANAGSCVLRLTIRKIGNAAVARTTEITVPALAATSKDWLHIDATSILPKTVALKDTTFRLDIDATNKVNELDEKNNLTWHNL